MNKNKNFRKKNKNKKFNEFKNPFKIKKKF
jgi:hypothetical protein